jgi:hypothetical protein
MPAGILLNVNSVICLSFKLQLKFRYNKCYTSVLVNFRTGLHLMLKFRKSEGYYEKRMADRCIVTSRLLKPIKQRLIDVTSFKLSKSHYSRSVLLTNALIILVLFFHIVWIGEFIKFQKHVKFPFSIFFLSYHFNFSFEAQNLLLFASLTLLSF